jgi:hypothetical protein
MTKVTFKAYLHDDYNSYERADNILDQLNPEDLSIDKDVDGTISASGREQFRELVQRPFYEVDLLCTLDTVTGQVDIMKATN